MNARGVLLVPVAVVGHHCVNNNNFVPGVIIAQLSSCDRIRHMEQCSLVLPSHEVAGEVLISDHSIYFVENSTDETHTTGVLSVTVKLVDVREYHLRWWQVRAFTQFVIQWGLEYRTRSDFKWLKAVLLLNGSDFEWFGSVFECHLKTEYF